MAGRLDQAPGQGRQGEGLAWGAMRTRLIRWLRTKPNVDRNVKRPQGWDTQRDTRGNVNGWREAREDRAHPLAAHETEHGLKREMAARLDHATGHARQREWLA